MAKQGKTSGGTRKNIKNKDRNIEFQVLIPEGFKGLPRGVLDALRRTKAVLEEEGRWARSTWYRNAHPEMDPEDAFCDGWQACMDGVLVSVTVGLSRKLELSSYEKNVLHKENHWEHQDVDRYRGEHVFAIVDRARMYLAAALRETFPGMKEFYGDANIMNGSRAQGQITDTNDRYCHSRTAAIKWVDKAIELAQKRAKVV